MRSMAPLLVLIALIVSPSLAQTTPNSPTCVNTDLRVLEGRSGTPCATISTILNTLQLAANVPPPPQGQGYGPPTADTEFPLASEPMCTTEMYNLVQGCAACQQSSTPMAEALRYPSLSEWTRRCDEIGVKVNSANFAGNVVDRFIPAWSRSAPIGDTFNVQNLLATLPAAPIPGVTLSSNSPNTPISAETASASLDSGSSVSSAASSSPPIGAIVGGVVGGVIFLLLVGGLIFWFCRRKRSRTHMAPSSEFMNARHVPLAQDDDDDREMSAPMAQRHSMMADAPPAFTPGQFKDPIFEKGVAISTGAMAMSSVGHSAATSYSPVTPSSAQQGPLRQSSGDQFQPGPLRQSSGDQYQGSLRQSSGDQYQSSADAYQTSASHQYHSSVDQYHSSVDQYRSDVHPHSPHSPEMAQEMAQGYRD